MSMYIKNDDLEFLNKVYKDLKEVEAVDYRDDANRLLNLIQRLHEQRHKDRQSTAKAVRKRRAKNPEYGRSKPEIERMRKQLIEFVTGTGGNK
jgi:hypothetical protein